MQPGAIAHTRASDIGEHSQPRLPEGTVTLFFSDIEGSTQVLHQLGDRYADLLAAYRHLVRSVVQVHDGHEVDTQGDSFFVAFADAHAALLAAAAIQQYIAAYLWPDALVPRTRIALHTGRPQRTSEGYAGLDLHRGARLCAAGHGGQLLLSESTRALVASDLPSPLGLRDLGQHRLKDLTQPEHVFQVIMPDIAADFPPLRTLNLHQHNLPIQPTPLIGREKEVRELRAYLGGEDTRLVTLTGPGGTGKTRLALQVAAEVVEDFPDGVSFVDLAPLTDPALVLSTIAHVLNVREVGEQVVQDALKEHLRARRLLLVLDNFEQVTAAAPVAGDLLRAAQGLKVVVTSREVLRLQGEQEYLVPPLEVPGLEGRFALEEVEQCAAVQLFVQRAQAVRRDFRLMAANARAVAEICVRLDGLPLAIELAAARVKVLPPEALLQRLGSRLKLLTGGARDLPARQQTLRNTIEWSYSLLEPDERRLFARLGVFVGGRTLEAAHAVCNDDELELDVLDGIQSLVDKSLLHQYEGDPGEPRFVMLETIHEYARERLEEWDEADDLRRRHAAYFLELAEHGDLELHGREQQAWLRRLDAEHDNLRAALTWAFDHDRRETALRLSGALAFFWMMRGHISEGYAWLDRLLTSGEGKGTDWAKALSGQGTLLWAQGRYDEARQCHQAALARFRQLGDAWGMALSLNNLGALALETGGIDQAVDQLKESVAIYQTVGAHPRGRGIAFPLYNLAKCAELHHEYARAAELYAEALERCRVFGNDFLRTYVLQGLGEVARAQGRLADARVSYRESLVVARSVVDPMGTAYSLEGIASTIATEDGSDEDLQHGARLIGAAEALREQINAVRDQTEEKNFVSFMTSIQARIGDEMFVAMRNEGRTMMIERVVDSILTQNA